MGVIQSFIPERELGLGCDGVVNKVEGCTEQS